MTKLREIGIDSLVLDTPLRVIARVASTKVKLCLSCSTIRHLVTVIRSLIEHREIWVPP